jgi:hypothetical protein
MTSEEFPAAEIVSQRGRIAGRMAVSRMWLATLACLAGAIALVWFSLEPAGTEIAIRFQEGHGLKPGDSLRNRGIDVGRVLSVELDKDLAGVDVRAELAPAAKALAREGTRFWIVRPTVDVTGISGLETAVGSKYIAVAPGASQSGRAQFEFTGVETPPIESADRAGLELVLRADNRYGINPGAPVSWRGVEIGRVLSCALSPDSRNVDIRIQINATHQRLVNSGSRFWVLSGVEFDAGLTGLKVSAESLATIVRGGIGVITPAESTAQPARSGDIFALYPEEDENWTERAAAINLLELVPPSTVALTASWQQKTLGFTRSLTRPSLGVSLEEQGKTELLLPASFLAPPSGSLEGSFKVSVDFKPEQALEWTAVPNGGALLARVPFANPDQPILPANRLRVPPGPEDCFVARQTSSGATVVESLGKQELNLASDRWLVNKPALNSGLWNGAPVLAAKDGQLIGLFVVDDTGAYIAPLK